MGDIVPEEESVNLADYGIEGRQTDIRKADLERGVWMVVVPEETSEWVAHVWKKGKELMGTRKEAEELCGFLKDKGFKALVVKIAPDKEAAQYIPCQITK